MKPAWPGRRQGSFSQYLHRLAPMVTQRR
eukprot:COSAG06_NODE_41079_length_395_cov_0.868243_1_plen_28_part_10